jgi:acyl-CoA thioesterase-1
MAVVVLHGCTSRADDSRRTNGGESQTPASAPDSAPAARDTSAPDRRTIVFLGTSLTAGLGLSDPDSAYPAVIARRIDSLGLNYEVVNAGVSGETSAGAVRRIDWVLRRPVDVLVIETGANDGLRGLTVDSMVANIDAIVRRARAEHPGVTIVLAGMEAPPNLGASYTGAFHAAFPDLAKRDHLVLIPFLLAGVAGVPALNQADGIHPNSVGAERVADNVWTVLGPILDHRPRKV